MAFDDASAEARAGKFTAALDWVAERHTDDGSPLAGKIDMERCVAAGHSRGGHAAVLAAQSDPRFDAVIAIAPAGPKALDAAGHSPPIFIAVGGRDSLLDDCEALWTHAAGGSAFVRIDGMDHFLQPKTASHEVVKRATAFLLRTVQEDERCESALDSERSGVQVRRK